MLLHSPDFHNLAEVIHPEGQIYHTLRQDWSRFHHEQLKGECLERIFEWGQGLWFGFFLRYVLIKGKKKKRKEEFPT